MKEIIKILKGPIILTLGTLALVICVSLLRVRDPEPTVVPAKIGSFDGTMRVIEEHTRTGLDMKPKVYLLQEPGFIALQLEARRYNADIERIVLDPAELPARRQIALHLAESLGYARYAQLCGRLLRMGRSLPTWPGAPENTYYCLEPAIDSKLLQGHERDPHVAAMLAAAKAQGDLDEYTRAAVESMRAIRGT